jgi:hypothetical protein
MPIEQFNNPNLVQILHNDKSMSVEADQASVDVDWASVSVDRASAGVDWALIDVNLASAGVDWTSAGVELVSAGVELFPAGAGSSLAIDGNIRVNG